MANDVKVLKLVTGEEVVARVKKNSNGLITLDKTIGSDTKLDGILAKIQKQEFDVELANELSDEIQKSIPKN